MPNIFDRLEANVHRITTNLMGYDAIWYVSNSIANPPLISHRARVHFKDPNKFGDYFMMEEVDYTLRSIVFEYYEGELPGLYERCRGGGNNTEFIRIKLVDQYITYFIHDIYKISDGHTYRGVISVSQDSENPDIPNDPDQ